jgi:general stress protein 26
MPDASPNPETKSDTKPATAKPTPAKARATTAKPAAKRTAPARKASSTAKPAAKRAAAKSANGSKPAAKPPRTVATAPARTPRSKASSTAKKPGKDMAARIDRIWELAEHISICMFITWDGSRQRARPLLAHLRQEEHAIYFLADTEGEKDDQVAKFPMVSLAFSDNRRAHYVTFTGKATLSNDRGMIKELWTPWAKAWWDSADDPKIRVIKVTPEDAEIWDSPGRIASTVAMLTAAVTRKTPKLLTNAKVSL